MLPTRPGTRAGVSGTEPVAPDGVPAIQAGEPGGSWGGWCRSTLWIPDLDGRWRAAGRLLAALAGDDDFSWQQRPRSGRVLASQARWIAGLDTPLAGFRVECEQRYRHRQLCTAESWQWSPADGAAVCTLPP